MYRVLICCFSAVLLALTPAAYSLADEIENESNEDAKTKTIEILVTKVKEMETEK